MDIVLIILGLIFMVMGFLGCLLPALPGPPLSYVGLLLLHFSPKYDFSPRFLILFAAITIVVTVMDNILPVWTARQSGGSRRGVWGSVIGLAAGLFVFPPWGIIFGPFVGAVIGELSTGIGTEKALRSGFSTFLGFLFGVVLKLAASGLMFWYFIKMIIIT
ncbi:MAG: DUF456 domain-containing protein [Candidatus Marinimicrobia bacterium]|nr:DUF456 domain-containing protein [Candidatus Neomarinimicrobiota bacterium]